MDNRDMMQYGYFQNMPGNMMYGNFGYTLYEINNRLNSLETRVKVLEQRLANNNSYQDDGSMYML